MEGGGSRAVFEYNEPMDILIGLVVFVIILAVCISFGAAVRTATQNLWDCATGTHENDGRPHHD